MAGPRDVRDHAGRPLHGRSRSHPRTAARAQRRPPGRHRHVPPFAAMAWRVSGASVRPAAPPGRQAAGARRAAARQETARREAQARSPGCRLLRPSAGRDAPASAAATVARHGRQVSRSLLFPSAETGDRHRVVDLKEISRRSVMNRPSLPFYRLSIRFESAAMGPTPAAMRFRASTKNARTPLDIAKPSY